ncbi:ABC transporter permease [Labrys sp. ZIDIC5]|uniref:ABC transporter permease n=1 Tax=Labrys sedimenti TaxID=3106036 RepID=UPI002ACA3124|nr:ABC transporter permease [Labrys sp. ZIDIC5]MDZ5450290.1 ABC transporter permease [Labrys sp. ZIDIC5]
MTSTNSSATAVSPQDAAKPLPLWRSVLVRPETMTLVLLAAAFVIACLLSPFFASLTFILESATYYAEFSIIALVLTLVIIAGEIDLSPASTMALTACLFGTVCQAGLPIGWAMAASLAAGLAMGAFNGFMVLWLRLPSLMVTIGTLIMYRGLAQVLAGDRSIGKFPAWFVGIDYRTLFGVPVPVLVFVAASLVLAFVLGATILGRQIYQIGTSEIAARHAGIKVRRIKFGLFLAMGLTSALCGLLAASRLASVRYDLATGGELQMVLIVMLGGTYIFGGRGTIAGTFIASWLLVIIATGMTVANIPVTYQLTVMGLLLIISIIATNTIYARNQR